MAQMTSDEARQIYPVVEAELNRGQLSENYSFAVSKSVIGLDGSLSITIKIAPKGAQAEAAAEKFSAEEFTVWARLLNVPAAWLGSEFYQNRRRFVITSLHPNRPQFPVTAVDENGRSFKFTVETVKRQMEVVETQRRHAERNRTTP